MTFTAQIQVLFGKCVDSTWIEVSVSSLGKIVIGSRHDNKVEQCGKHRKLHLI